MIKLTLRESLFFINLGNVKQTLITRVLNIRVLVIKNVFAYIALMKKKTTDQIAVISQLVF